jgi:uncharacterized protein YuzE
MKRTAVEWLVNKILIEVDKYDEECNVIGIEYWNAFIECADLSEYVNKAKEIEKQQQGYNEEEVIRLLVKRELFLELYDMANEYEDANQWFKKFKK